MHYVYILKSIKNDSIYIGVTSDVTKRLTEHNAGLNVSTKRYLPWQLVYFEAYLSREDAINREHNLKYRGRAIRQVKDRIQNSLVDAK